MNRADGIDCYQKALRQGQRDYREKMNAGQSPFLPVLDDILQNVPVENQIPLGQVEIPLELLVGTKTSGRTAAFASNFMPLLGLKTEFATKWINLCVSHLDEGIRDPITCYEYMGRFYVQEGNKRVSVLKYFDASSITGNVTRVVPQYSDDPAVQMYYEFMHFYPVMQNYLLTFTKPGSYARLQKILGKAPDEKWTGEDRTEVLSLYNWVKKAFLAHGGARLQCTVGDVLLLLLRVYTKEELANLSPSELSEKLDALWDDVLALQKSDPVQVSDKPAAPKQTGLLDFILPGKHTAPSHLKVAFVHERTPGTSSWTSQHEFGRTQLDTVFEGKVETAAYFNAIPGKNADALVEQAITDGADVVFTTSPKLVGASLRAAVRHPQVHILNCSMEMPYASIRTYYTRVYEAKFITGAIAAVIMFALMKIFPPVLVPWNDIPSEEIGEYASISDMIVNFFTASDFVGLLTRKAMLPLIVFSVLFGFATNMAGGSETLVAKWLSSMTEVMMKFIKIITYYAPVAFFAIFAGLVADYGPQIAGSYGRAMAVYYPLCFIYIFTAFPLFAWFGGGKHGIKTMFRHITKPALVSLGTCSSVATIPTNLEEAEDTGVSKDVAEMVVPLGATMHMDGSCFSCVLKIAFVWGVFGQEMSWGKLIPIVLVAVLSSVGMSGVPGGGYIGEYIICSIFFPNQIELAFPILVAIGNLVDPPATMINSAGDYVVTYIVSRFADGKDWLDKAVAKKNAASKAE